MTGRSRKETLARAKAMGLELSADGQSWIPIKELIVPSSSAHHPQNPGLQEDTGQFNWRFFFIALTIVAASMAALVFVLMIGFALLLAIASGGGGAFG